jgi:hypothetical protein
MFRHPLMAAGCAALALAGGAATVAEILQAGGDGAVTVRHYGAEVREVVIRAESGDVRLDRSLAGVRVRETRRHVIGTPQARQRLRDGVLELETICVLGALLPCATDYRVAVPAGVAVRVRKTSGEVDASGLGGGVVDLDGDREWSLGA